MLGKTHLAFGTAIGLGTFYFANENGMDMSMVVIPVTMVASLLPDIDKANSKLGRKVKPISNRLEAMGHRTFTHSLLFLVITSLVLFRLVDSYNLPIEFLYGVILGVLSHFITDMMTKQGIPLLYPMKKRYAIKLMKTGSLLETFFRIGCYGLIFFIIFNLI